MSGNVRCTRSPRECPHEASQVGSVVRTSYDKIRNTKVGELGENVVQRDESAGSGGAIVVPDLAVLWIVSNLRHVRGQFERWCLGKRTEGAPLGIKSYCDGAVKFPSVVKSEVPPLPLCFVAGATTQTLRMLALFLVMIQLTESLPLWPFSLKMRYISRKFPEPNPSSFPSRMFNAFAPEESRAAPAMKEDRRIVTKVQGMLLMS